MIGPDAFGTAAETALAGCAGASAAGVTALDDVPGAGASVFEGSGVVPGWVNERFGGTDMLGGAIARMLPAVVVIGAAGTGAEEFDDQGLLKALSDSGAVCPSFWTVEAQTANSAKPAATQDAIFNLIRVNVLVIRLLSECEASVFIFALQRRKFVVLRTAVVVKNHRNIRLKIDFRVGESLMLGFPVLLFVSMCSLAVMRGD